MTNSWLASFVNAVVRIKELNQRDQNSHYIKTADWNNYLAEALELASLEAATEAFSGIYSVQQLEAKFNRDKPEGIATQRILTLSWELLAMTYQLEAKDLSRSVRKFVHLH